MSWTPESVLPGAAARSARRDLIRAIQATRRSKVITYITSDRPMLSGQISEDAVPLIHERVLGFAPSERGKLDLIIYSRGGDSDVPWSVDSIRRAVLAADRMRRRGMICSSQFRTAQQVLHQQSLTRA